MNKAKLYLSKFRRNRISSEQQKPEEVASVLMEESTMPGARISVGEHAEIAESIPDDSGDNPAPEAVLIAEVEHDPGALKRTEGFIAQLGLSQTPAKYAAAVEFSREVIAIGKRLRDEALSSNRNPFSSAITIEDVDEAGGREHFLKIFVRFYERLLADPLMRPIFNESSEERPPTEHGTLLGAFLLMRIGHSTALYFKVRHQGHGLGGAHYRAKQCPHRPAGHQGRGFTFDQGHAWLGNLWKACDDTETSTAFRNKLLEWLATVIDVYAPFIEAT